MAVLTDGEELELAWRALSGQDRSGGSLTVALKSGGGRFRAGILYPGDDETLLIGFGLEALPERAALPEGEGFRVEAASEPPDAPWQRWLMLTRQTGAGRDLFTKMAADVIDVVILAGQRTEAALLSLALARIRAWQDFMKRPNSGVLPAEAELGLAGELTVLLQLASLGAPAAGLVRAWVGPARGLQDFQTDPLGLEVKTTLSVAGFPARVSSLEQLDPGLGRVLVLAAVRLCLQDSGSALPDLVADVRALVGGDSRTAAALERSLMLAGYLDSAASEYLRRFHPVEIRVFDIDEAFPKLARSELRPEIRAAVYDIDLDLVAAAPASLESVLVRFGSF